MESDYVVPPVPMQAGWTDQLLLLTRCQREVAYWIGRGKSYKGVAREIHRSERTVDAHIQAIYGRLRRVGVQRITELAVWAVGTGLVDHPEWIEEYSRERTHADSSGPDRRTEAPGRPATAG